MTNSTTKITKKDRYNSIIELLTSIDGTSDLIDFCENEIALLDKKSAKAKETAAAKRTEADPLTEAVKAALTTEYATISAVTAAVGDADTTEAKVRYRLNALVEDGVAEKTQISIPGTDGAKARKLQAYKLVG